MYLIKRIFMLLAIFLMLMPKALVYADVLVEPQNDFFFRHGDECEYFDHNFYANGEGGSVSLKKEPGSKEEVAAIQNDEILYVSHVYNLKGETWGIAEIYTPETRWVYGWVPLSQLLLIYDNRSFSQDHHEEFESYTGNYEEFLTAEQIVYWKYPESGIVVGNFINKDKDFEPFISYVYIDEQGRKWGFTGWGINGDNRDSWICLSDPENSDIPANPAYAPASIREDEENNKPNSEVSAASNNKIPVIWVAVILVGVLLIVTGILIWILWKPNKAG